MLVRGSTACSSVYGDDLCNSKIVVVVESEIDALLIHQEAGDLITSIGLGSCQVKPDFYAHQIITEAPLVLVALDKDNPGEAAYQWWANIYPHTQRVIVPNGKDPGEYYQMGGNIRNWVQSCLPIQLTSYKKRQDYDRRSCLGDTPCPFLFEDKNQYPCCEFNDEQRLIDIETCPLGHWHKTPDGILVETA